MIKNFNVNNALKLNEVKIRQLILDKAQEKEQIIYGARAINRQLPLHLQKETEDYDILARKPKKIAIEVSNEIKKLIRDGKVEVEKGLHKGTYKVKVDGKTIIDYTQLKRIPKTKNVFANKYYDISSIKRNLQKSLKKKGTEFRREKDADSLKRIKFYETMLNL